jgi:hypothetical protein
MRGMSFGQGGPYGPGGQPPTPDWGALADATAQRNRRRRWLLVGGGVIATGALAAVVALAVAGGSGNASGGQTASRLPTPQDLPSESQSPEPSFSNVQPPAPPKPGDIIASAKKDTAPLNTRTLFPDAKAVTDGRSYAKATTSATNDCAAVTQGDLGAVLTNNGCREVFRATYSRGGIAVTVGIAVFDTAKAAEQAKNEAGPNIASLSGGGVPVFCRQTDCQSSANSVGRYAYFTVSGYTSGKAVVKGDTEALQGSRDLSDYAFRRIWARGTAQASAIATAGNG